MREVYTGMNPNEIESECLNGIYNEIANVIGIDATIALYSVYRGQQVTFPVNFFTTEFIASRVVKKYDGSNIKQLATKYGYSEKWIRKMIKESKEHKEPSPVHSFLLLQLLTS